MLCDHLEGWDGKEVAGRFKKGTCVDLWPIHVVWQKLTKHCKAIILQFKKIFYLKKYKQCCNKFNKNFKKSILWKNSSELFGQLNTCLPQGLSQ